MNGTLSQHPYQLGAQESIKHANQIIAELKLNANLI
jgi:hypothetical protein